jgi:hypothetical protein
VPTPAEEDLADLRRALAETLAAIDRVRAAVDGSDGDAALELPPVVRPDRPGESIPMLEQEASDLRREIRALEAEIARAT